MARRRARRNARNGGGSASLKDNLAPLLKVPTYPVHKHVRIEDFGYLSPAAVDRGWGFDFRLDRLPSHAEYTSLYDQYKIDLVEVIWELVYQEAVVNLTSQVMPVILAFPDYDDANNPPTLASANQHSQLERLALSPAYPIVRRSVKPKVAFGLSGAPPNQGGVTATFIDCASDAVPHYGVKFWVKNYSTATVTATGAALSVSFRYHLSFKFPI